MVYHSAEWYTVTVGAGWLARQLVGCALGYDLPTQVEILARRAHKKALDAARLERRAARLEREAAYAADVSLATGTGRVVFDSEGGFRIVPSDN